MWNHFFICNNEIRRLSNQDGSQISVLSYASAIVLSPSSWCRQAKAELRTATAKVDEMTKLLQNVQDQMQRRVRDDKYMCRIKKYTAGENWLSICPSLMSHLSSSGTSEMAVDCVS